MARDEKFGWACSETVCYVFSPLFFTAELADSYFIFLPLFSVEISCIVSIGVKIIEFDEESDGGDIVFS